MPKRSTEMAEARGAAPVPPPARAARVEDVTASRAPEDRFAEAFEAVGATVDPDLKLGF